MPQPSVQRMRQRQNTKQFKLGLSIQSRRKQQFAIAYFSRCSQRQGNLSLRYPRNSRHSLNNIEVWGCKIIPYSRTTKFTAVCEFYFEILITTNSHGRQSRPNEQTYTTNRLECVTPTAVWKYTAHTIQLETNYSAMCHLDNCSVTNGRLR